MVSRAPNEEDRAKETGPSLHFAAPGVPAGRAGCHWPPGACNREPAAALAGLCSTETPKPGSTAPKRTATPQCRERRASSRHSPTPSAPSSFTTQTLAVGWLYTHARQPRLGVWQSRAGAAPPLQAEGCCTHTVTHGLLLSDPHSGICLSSSASSPASKLGPLCTPEPQHPCAEPCCPAVPVAPWGHKNQAGLRAAGAGAERAMILQTSGRKAAFGPFLVSRV